MKKEVQSITMAEPIATAKSKAMAEPITTAKSIAIAESINTVNMYDRQV